MQKKYVVINYLEHPVFIAPIIDGTSEEYLKIKKEAEANLNELIKQWDDVIFNLKIRLTKAEQDIKHLKGED